MLTWVSKRPINVAGRYELPAPNAGSTVAVKVIDMLGEEAIISQLT